MMIQSFFAQKLPDATINHSQIKFSKTSLCISNSRHIHVFITLRLQQHITYQATYVNTYLSLAQ